MAARTIGRLAPAHYVLIMLSSLFLWPALINGGPFFFSDTTAYVRGADAIVDKITHRHSEWWIGTPGDPKPADPGKATGGTQPPVAAKPVMLGRSIYDGMLLYTGVLLGSFWVPIAIHALLAGLCLLGLLRHAVDPTDGRRFTVAAIALFAIASLTPLPYFVCFMMPDLSTGLGLTAAIALLAGWEREGRGARLAWFALLVLAALAHSSNILILASLAAIGIAIAIATRHRRQRMAAAALLAAACLGLGGEALFSLAVAKSTGLPPLRPPFLTARLVDDGAGTAYLKTHCPANGLLLCRFVPRLPLYSDDFLWRTDGKGVFMTLPPAGQRILAAEQTRFVLAVLRAEPGAVAIGFVRDFATQIGWLRIEEFNYSDQQRDYLRTKVPPTPFASIERTAAFAGRMPTGLVDGLLAPLTLISLFAIVAMMVAAPPTVRSLQGYAVIAIAGILVNDLICACLSTAHGRYQTRVIWLLPIIATMLFARLAASRPVTRPQPA